MSDHIETLLPCARGCTFDDKNPRPARHGKFCNRCYGQYAHALDMAADLVVHIVSMISFKGTDEAKVDTSRGETPVPFNVQAFHDANETYRRLVYWSKVWADTLRIEPPKQTSRVWRDNKGRVVGFRRGAPAMEAGRNVHEVSRWLRNRLDDILEHPGDDLDYWRDDLADVYRINARWPREMKPRYGDARCPDDDCQGRIAIFPPREFMDDERIVCEGCGRWFERKDYDFIASVLEQKEREKRHADQKAEAVVRHLMKKYPRLAEGA